MRPADKADRRLEKALRFSVLSLFAALPLLAHADISVQDDSNHTVTLAAPAQRIISLAPHATEILYAAGAGDHVVGVSEFSDYPAAARKLPLVGSASALDLERILALKPDLIVAWGSSSGQLAPQINKLRALGIKVYDNEPTDFEGIASSLERLSLLAGSQATGNRVATQFRARLRELDATYAQRAAVTVFYQIWKEPLMTLNDTHLVSKVLVLCGGRNIFGKLAAVAPTVNVEAVLAANPEAIIARNSGEDLAHDWRRFGKMTAVERGNIYGVNADLLSRAGPRILDGAQELCGVLDDARKKRPK